MEVADFYRTDALPVTRLTASRHSRKSISVVTAGYFTGQMLLLSQSTRSINSPRYAQILLTSKTKQEGGHAVARRLYRKLAPNFWATQ